MSAITIRKSVCLEHSEKLIRSRERYLFIVLLVELISLSRRISFACSLEIFQLSARRVTDMGLIKCFDVLVEEILGTVQES